MTPHLTHEQLCDLLLADPSRDVHESGRLELLREHLRSCHTCAAELTTLNQSLAVFRSTTTAWASSEWTSQQFNPRTHAIHRPTSSSRAVMFPAVWSAVAAALVVAAMLPLMLHRNAPATPKAPAPAAVVTQPHNRQSDEALLEEIDQTLSSSIPSPMQPLNDPTAGLHSQPNTQRKN